MDPSAWTPINGSYLPGEPPPTDADTYRVEADAADAVDRQGHPTSLDAAKSLETLKAYLASGDMSPAHDHLATLEGQARDADHASARRAQALAVVARQWLRDAAANMAVAAAQGISMSLTGSDDDGGGDGATPSNNAWHNPAWMGREADDDSEELEMVDRLLRSNGLFSRTQYSAHEFLLEIREAGLQERRDYTERNTLPDDVVDATYSRADFVNRTSSLKAYIQYLADDDDSFSRIANRRVVPLDRFDSYLQASDNAGVMSPDGVGAIYRETDPGIRERMISELKLNIGGSIALDLLGGDLERSPTYWPTVQFLRDPINRLELGIDIPNDLLDRWEFAARALDTKAAVERLVRDKVDNGTLTRADVDRLVAFLDEQCEDIEQRQADFGVYRQTDVDEASRRLDETRDRIRKLFP
jgi:hypothetical protein